MGWTASTITFGIFICSIVSVPGSPFAGWLAHRVGLRRVILAGLPLYLLAFAALGPLSMSKTGWIAGWSLVAMASIFSKGNLWMLWVAQKFDASRGMAFAAVMSGAGILAMFVPLLTQLGIEALGWRATFAIIAGTSALIAIPVCVIAMRLCPADAGGHLVQGDTSGNRPQGLGLREALRIRSFWQLALISFLIGAGLVALQIHLVPLFRSAGLNARTAAAIAGGFGGAALVGRFVAGALLDRFPAGVIGMISLLLPAAGCVLFFAVPVEPWSATAMALLLGIGVGAEGDVLAYIISRHFGIRNFGTIFGFTSGAFALGAGVGPQFMSAMFDRFGNYDLVVWVLFGVLVFCSFLFVTMGQQPVQPVIEGEGAPA